MALKNGAKITAHTRLATDVKVSKDHPQGIRVWAPGDVLTVPGDVSAEQAGAWTTAGSAALFVPE